MESCARTLKTNGHVTLAKDGAYENYILSVGGNWYAERTDREDAERLYKDLCRDYPGEKAPRAPEAFGPFAVGDEVTLKAAHEGMPKGSVGRVIGAALNSLLLVEFNARTAYDISGAYVSEPRQYIPVEFLSRTVRP